MASSPILARQYGVALTLAVDYVLVYRGRKLAVIEAKAWDKEPTAGVGQAKSQAAGRRDACGV